LTAVPSTEPEFGRLLVACYQVLGTWYLVLF